MKELNNKVSELVGAIIGDGCISYKPEINQYFVEIVGNPKEEKAYFQHLSSIFKEEFALKTFITIRERGLRMKIHSKEFVEFLVNQLKLVPNKDKGANIVIPSLILKKENLTKYCLRGIVDTDGSFFLSRKGKRLDYPSIEISTTSNNLAEQIRTFLSKSFRIGFREFKQANYKKIYRVSLNGDKMVEKWFQEIGFSNPRNKRRYKRYKGGAAGI